MRVILLILFLLAGVQSVAILGSSTIERNAVRTIESGGGHANMSEQLSFGLRLDPWRIELYELLARFEREAVKREQLARQMVEREPARPDGWLSLLRFKLSQGEIDEELDSIFRELSAVAPYEPLVQEAVIQLGLRYWLEISPAARRAVVDTAVRAMEGEAPYRQTQRHALVTNGGLLSFVCAVSPEISECL